MVKLIYSMLMSLDGYVADQNGEFDWAKPDEEVHTFANQLESGTGTHLYGRRMYEVMTAWETLGTDDHPGYILDFGRMKASADQDISIGGPGVAEQALKTGLVDACHFILAPIIVGGGTRGVPSEVRISLNLIEERRFSNGMVYLHYSTSQ